MVLSERLHGENFFRNALCCKLQSINPCWWFSEKPEEIEKAQSICSLCSVREPCLDWANSFEKDQDYRYGIYGGLTAEQRSLAISQSDDGSHNN